MNVLLRIAQAVFLELMLVRYINYIKLLNPKPKKLTIQKYNEMKNANKNTLASTLNFPDI